MSNTELKTEEVPTTELAVDNVTQIPVMIDDSNPISAIMMNPSLLEQALAMAEHMASAKVTVPKHLTDSVGDCYAIVLQSTQWRLNPYVVAQKTHLVNGTLGYEAQLVVAVLQASGAIKGGFKYEYDGNGAALTCRAGAVIAGETDITWGEWLNSGDVTTKNSPLWKTNPKQQMAYLQSKNWARLYCPGAILGVYTPDELQDAEPFNHSSIQQAKAALEQYPADRFNENYPKWRELVANGEKPATAIITQISNSYQLTDEQLANLSELQQFEPIEGEKA